MQCSGFLLLIFPLRVLISQGNVKPNASRKGGQVVWDVPRRPTEGGSAHVTPARCSCWSGGGSMRAACPPPPRPQVWDTGR